MAPNYSLQTNSPVNGESALLIKNDGTPGNLSEDMIISNEPGPINSITQDPYQEQT